MPVEIGAFLRDVQHFSTRRIGAYTLLMFAGWVEGGRLMRSDDELRTITRLSLDDWAEDRPALVEKYRVDPDGAWVHEGMQRRMMVLGIPVDGSRGALPAQEAAPVAGPDPVKSAAARARWGRRSDADLRGADADLRGADAGLHAGVHPADAERHAEVHANLNLNQRSSTNQLSSLDAAREAEERGSGGSETGESGGDQRVSTGDLAEEVVRIGGNSSAGFAAALVACIGEWRALGFSDDAICTEVQRQTDAKRMQLGAWKPSTPTYYTPGLKRAAEDGARGDGGGDRSGDLWEQRVESFSNSRFWLPDWGSEPDADPPNPSIPLAVLRKFGFGKAA